MVRNKRIENDNQVYEIHGGTWNPVVINIKLSGKANYILTKMGLFNPNVAKTTLAKDLLEKALIEIDATLSKV